MHIASRLTVLALIGSSLAAAAGIQIGGGVNGVNGLTSSYVGSQTGWSEKNYDIRLFLNATESSSALTPYTGYTATGGQTTPETLTDSTSGVTFAMIADSGCTGTTPCGSNNFWEGFQATTLTIPVGVLDVSNAWTMINNIWGTPNAVDTTVSFDFGTSATGGIVDTLTVALTNSGTNPAGTPSGQISTAIDCTTVAATCNSYAIGPTAASSTITTSGTGASLLPSITVVTDNVETMAYNGGVSGAFAGSKGNVVLGDQGFNFGNAFSGLYLVDIKIAEASGTSGTSETALSAITVFTPEPSTAWLLLGGFGGIGLLLRRRVREQI